MTLRRARLLLAGAVALAAAGCAVQRGPLVVDKPSSSALPSGMAPQDAQQAIAIGRSTKGDVAAALGKATIVKFDSGYEVWVYQAAKADPRDPTELVVLFSPSGIAQKTRLRIGGLQPPRR